MTPSQPVPPGGGGITGLVKNLVTSQSLESLSEHTLQFFQQTASSLEATESLTELVVFKRLEKDGYKIYEQAGPASSKFEGCVFGEEDWPEEQWDMLELGKKIDGADLESEWFGTTSSLPESVYLKSIPFQSGNQVLGFYLLLSDSDFHIPDTYKFLSGEFGEIIGEVLRFKQDSWHVEKRLNTFEILDGFYEGINKVESFREILIFCLETFQELFDAPEGSVMIYNRERNELKVEHSSLSVSDEPMVFQMGEGVAGTALEEDELINLPDVTESEFFKEFDQDDLTLKSLLCIPLRTPRGPVGVVNLSDHDEKRKFDPDSIPGLEIMRNRVSASLESILMTQKLEKVANTDELTGIYNRRYINSHLESLFEKVHDKGTPLAVVLLDLDNFKAINDQYGHQVGDRVLKRFADALEENARDRDLVGRFGGDEFIYVMPDTSFVAARQQGKRLVEHLSGLSVDTDDSGTIFPKASLGLATAGPGSSVDDLGELIRTADRHLYQSKETDGFDLQVASVKGESGRTT